MKKRLFLLSMLAVAAISSCSVENEIGLTPGVEVPEGKVEYVLKINTGGYNKSGRQSTVGDQVAAGDKATIKWGDNAGLRIVALDGGGTPIDTVKIREHAVNDLYIFALSGKSKSLKVYANELGNGGAANNVNFRQGDATGSEILLTGEVNDLPLPADGSITVEDPLLLMPQMARIEILNHDANGVAGVGYKSKYHWAQILAIHLDNTKILFEDDAPTLTRSAVAADWTAAFGGVGTTKQNMYIVRPPDVTDIPKWDVVGFWGGAVAGYPGIGVLYPSTFIAGKSVGFNFYPQKVNMAAGVEDSSELGQLEISKGTPQLGLKMTVNLGGYGGHGTESTGWMHFVRLKGTDGAYIKEFKAGNLYIINMEEIAIAMDKAVFDNDEEVKPPENSSYELTVTVKEWNQITVAPEL